MNRIEEIAKDLGYNRMTELPELLDMTRNTLYKLANEKAELSADRINRFCELFEVTSDYLIGRTTSGIFVNFNDKKYALDRMHYIYYKNCGFIEIKNKKRYFTNISKDNIREIPDNDHPLVELVNIQQ